MTAFTERAVIFGAGSRGRHAFAAIAAHSHVVAFVDNDTAQQGASVHGCPVWAPATLDPTAFDVVYIASSRVTAIRQQLTTQGVAESRIRLAPGVADVASEPVPQRIENSLDQYLSEGFNRIAGWLYMPAVEATLALAEIQRGYMAPGPVCEIGVWEGRYLSLISFVPATPQRVLAIDPLIHGGDRDAQRTRLKNNVAKYACRPDLITLLEQDSKRVSPDAILSILGAKCQFVSVDGDHTMEGALHDLSIAEAITVEGGIVSVDDVPNFGCPGVTEATMRHTLVPGSRLAPFLVIANKLFMTQAEYCERYRRDLVQRAETGQCGSWGEKMLGHRNHMKALQVPVRYLGQELLVAA